MHTFFCGELTAPGELVELEQREEEHLFRTLRAVPGDEVGLLDGQGGYGTALIESGGRLRMISLERVPEPAIKLLLYTAAPRRAKLDVLFKQCAELGVWEIHLLLCERSVAVPEGSSRWEPLLREGCKQSRNPFLPKVAPAMELRSVLAEFKGVGYFGSVRSSSSVRERFPTAVNLGWFVGPEGGFTDTEEKAMLGVGIQALNLGPYVLRMETAAVCGLAVLRRMVEGAIP